MNFIFRFVPWEVEWKFGVTSLMDSEPFEDENNEVSGSFGLLMRMKLR